MTCSLNILTLLIKFSLTLLLFYRSGNGKKPQQHAETHPNHAEESKGVQQGGQSQGEKAGTSSASGDPTSSGGPKGPGRSRILTEDPSSFSGKRNSFIICFLHKHIINNDPIGEQCFRSIQTRAISRNANNKCNLNSSVMQAIKIWRERSK